MEVLRQTAGMEEIILDENKGIADEYTKGILLPDRFYTNDYAAVGYKYDEQGSEIQSFLRCVYPEYLDTTEFKCVTDDTL